MIFYLRSSVPLIFIIRKINGFTGSGSALDSDRMWT